ncbi:condensation domain-containing protein [Streptomyces sp. NEAU-PBA10]|uniref:condensation domain-containing protein n=2 Tax=Streptomyces TaxID=1883 RepID=UPI001EE4CC93|nr:condensation domain-containing protein [Streptomyces sp. T7(2022)]MCG5122391.1 condensation domain-containing protein [Streptomyces sp. T7(2022)]
MTADRATSDRATSERPAAAATTVVVDPGEPPYRVPPVLEVRGPLTEGRVAAALDHAAARALGARPWRHRLQQVGPDHHLLHVEPGPAAAPDAFPAGLVADLLTARDRPPVPLGPAQLDLARRGESAAASPLSGTLDAPEPFDPTAVEAALRALARAHPLLAARVDTGAGGGIHAAPLAADTVCTVADGVPRSREREALAAAGQELRPSARRSLHAVLLRGRRRLVLLAHELVADQISLGILLADLRAALARPEEELGAEAVRYPEWAAALPAVATDPRECDHWREVAEGRAAAAAFRSRSPLPDTTPERHQGFVLGRAATARLTGPVARRFGLLPAQLLTGALGLALVRWRGTRVASFDVCTDGRQGTPALDRTVGPLAETEPVLLDGAPDEQATEFTERAARSLSAVGRAAFGACREHAADPALRLVLRELVPVLVRFTPDTAVRPVPRPARTAGPYAIEAGARVRGGRLHVGCDWLPAAHDGVTAESVDALLAEVRAVLDELADAPGEPSGQFPVAASPLQRELLADADAHPGTGRQIEQLTWVWHGPLDTGRFTAAWQSVFDREAVLRSSFDHGRDPALTVHDRAVPEVVRIAHPGASWPETLAADQRRGLDPRSPGPLRLTLLDGSPGDGTDVPATRVLLTYHQALLDTWSVRLLLAEFYRAYLAEGDLPGGDRRPDVRDHARWLAGQDLAPAREFWLGAAPVPQAAASVAAYATAPLLTEGTGSGRARVRLASSEAARLAAWAGQWGATESGALQAAWALMLYRAAGADGPLPVRFSVAASGRGIPLDGVERLPGALRNPQPVQVDVDPGTTVPALLAALRDQAIDLASYEWVSAGQIHGWAGGAEPHGGPGDGAGGDSLLVFESSLDPLERLEPAFAAHGIRMEFAETTGAATSFPVTLVSHHDAAGGLVLSVTHDRSRLADATGLLAHCAGLLRELPYEADGSTTVAEFLDALPPAPSSWPAFVTLRPGTGGAVCLVPSPGVPRTWYTRLSRLYPGPESVVLLRLTPEGPGGWYAVLRRLAEKGEPLVLGAFSGGGADAYGTARLLAADGVRPPLVVLAADTGTDEAVKDLARLLDQAVRR